MSKLLNSDPGAVRRRSLDLASTSPWQYREVSNLFRLHRLDADFALEVLPTGLDPLPAAIESRVERIWEEELQLSGGHTRFNGPIFSLVRCAPRCLTVRPTEYRQHVAQLRQPDLRAVIGVRPVGVTGVLASPDGVVLGHRSESVTQDPGRWEPVPAGGLHRSDPYEQLRDELYEEVGLTAGSLDHCQAVGLVEDVETGIHDIVFDLRTRVTARGLFAAHAGRGGNEYAELAIVKVVELADYVAEHRASVSPGCVPVLQTAGLLPWASG